MIKPIIAVTMGDPTGIGPEIIAKALAEPKIQEVCIPLVLGDRQAMERGVAVSGTGFPVVTVDEIPPVSPVSGVIYLREI